MLKKSQITFLITMVLFLIAIMTVQSASTIYSTFPKEVTELKIVELAEPELACTETDNGFNVFLKGETTLKTYCKEYQEINPRINESGLKTNKIKSDCKMETEIYEDFCIDEFNLYEYSCNKMNIKETPTECKFGCLKGACLDKPHVFFSIISDTEVSNCKYPKENYYRMNCNFSREYHGNSSITSRLLDKNLRARTNDSYGNPFKMSWYTITGENFCEGNNTNCISVFKELYNNFGKEIEEAGDDVQWHFHNFEWYNESQCWSQAMDFNEKRIQVANRILNDLMFELDYFPTSFRLGWGWHDEDLMQYMNNLLFTDYTNLAPLINMPDNNPPPYGKVPKRKCFGNYYDWSQAPKNWSYYNPNEKDYQSEGNMNITIFKCVPLKTNHEIDKLYKEALELNESVVGCAYMHNYWNESPEEIENFLNRVVKAKSEEYGIPLVYVNSIEGIQKALRTSDKTSPQITLTKIGDTIKIESNEELYGTPYAAIQLENRSRQRIEIISTGENTYSVQVPKQAKIIAVGAVDTSGNPIVQKLDLTSNIFFR